MQQNNLILAFLIGALTIPASQADENTPRQQRINRAQMAEEAAAKKTNERRAQKSSRDQGKGEKTRDQQDNDAQADKQTPLSAASDAATLQQDFIKDGLESLEIRPDIASKIATESTDPAKTTDAKTKLEQITDAAAHLDLVSVDPKVRKDVIDKISRSEKPKDTANEEVGKAAIDEVFGKNVTKLLPADKVPKARDVFVNLAKIQAALVTVGGDPNGKEVQDAVEEGAKLGVVNDEDARKVMEDGAHKVLDKSFPPAKPGEKLGDRLARMAKEQEKLQAELNAQKAAAAARAAAKARLAAAAKISKDKLGGAAFTQGAAGSTAIGRSVSAKVEAGGGGGSGTSSGAGTAKVGTGIVRSQHAGVGGSQVREDVASARLAAGDGGSTNAGQPTTGKQPTTNPGNDAAAPASSAPLNDQQHGPQAPILEDSEFNSPASAQAPTSQQPASEKTDTPGHGAQPSNNPSSSVTSPADEILISPNGGHVKVGDDGGGVQSADGNSRTTTTYFADGTYESNTVSVTRDSSGKVNSTTETQTTGTWASDTHGNKQKTSATTSTSTTRSSSNASSNNNNGNNNNQSSNDKDGDGKDDDDDTDNDDDNGDDDKKSEDPPPAEEAAADDSEAAKSEESKQSSSTPNPMDIGGGDSTQLAARTGGRIGNQEARRQQRGLDLARFGGAAGPNRDGKGGAPTLLTPEEKANAERALNMRLGGGVTNPNPLGKGNVVATDRDLKELHLRGNGGAKGPTESSAPATPQDPHSPLGGVGPAPVPAGGTRINGAAAKGAAINRQIKRNGQVNTDAVKSTVK
ncbi:hypothetical protein [Methylophilus aquaticus]|uniref:Uncharacterized protein n=1 Tax=Methylophilus aquaticus TaxID=1971610 RepID=A0ABT9JVB2_9PROT|nr:hypothetical protein [Methylophilus aquaticus]MDP8568517.1 hypothetical protein [Methylophilus aquaticus]